MFSELPQRQESQENQKKKVKTFDKNQGPEI